MRESAVPGVPWKTLIGTRRLGSMRVYPVTELERWLERHAERVLEDVAA